MPAEKKHKSQDDLTALLKAILELQNILIRLAFMNVPFCLISVWPPLNGGWIALMMFMVSGPDRTFAEDLLLVGQ